MGKSTISMAIFNSYVSHNQRVIGFVGGFQVIAPPSWLFWETWNSRSFGGFRRQVWGRLRGCFQACLGWRAAFLTNLFGLGWNQQMIWYASMNHHETLSIINDRQPSLTASFTRITPLATWKNIATAQVAIGISLWVAVRPWRCHTLWSIWNFANDHLATIEHSEHLGPQHSAWLIILVSMVWLVL